jgi:6-phosphogluconolactonase
MAYIAFNTTKETIMTSRRTFLLGLTIASLTVASTFTSIVPATATEGTERVGTIYTASNATTGNQILAFDQLRNGTLKAIGSVATGGTGTGAGLGNQSGITLSPDRRLMFVVNAGSNEISTFRFDDREPKSRQPKLLSKVSSGGTRPVSVSLRGNRLYVLNAGSDDVVGFKVGEWGQLNALPNSRRALSGTGTGPAQVQFSPDGRFVVVTEKATNLISTFPVRSGGYLGDRVSNPSSAKTPFGFSFDQQGDLLVSEAAGGPPNISSISSYKLLNDGRLKVITASVKTNQLAACWVAVSRSGKYAYVSNTASGTLSGFMINSNGTLSALTPDGKTGNIGVGTGPIDLAISRNDQFVNSLNTGKDNGGSISVFRMLDGGALASAFTLPNVPKSANGLVAR